MPRREETVSAGTRSDLPITIGKLPVYTSGAPSPAISNSIFGQSADGHSVVVGVGAAINVGQVANAPAVVVGEGAIAWGDGAVAIGKNVTAGQTAARDGAVAIGDGVTVNVKNGIRIGSALAVGGVTDDTITIGTLAVSIGPGVCIGKLANQQGLDGIAIGTSSNAGEGSSIAIGKGAACGASGLGIPNKNIAIGDGATVPVTVAGASIAIGAGASTAFASSIALGTGAVCISVNEIHIGSAANLITVLTLDAGNVAFAVGLRSGGTGGIALNNAANSRNLVKADETALAGDTALSVWDVNSLTTKRVTVGVVDSGGVGFRLLRIPN